MRSPVKTRRLLSLALLALFCRASSAQMSIGQHPEPPSPQLLFQPHTSPYPTTGTIPCIPFTQPEGNPLGETFLLGTTWGDLQHICTIGRMISSTQGRGVHFCWMYGLGEGAIDRHVYYNYFTNGVLMWPDLGLQLDQGRGGYPTISHFNEGEAVVAFHHATDSPFTAVAYDFLEGFGAFQEASVDNPVWGEVLWPKMAICNQGNVHLVAFEHSESEWGRITYTRFGDGGASFIPWTVIDTLLVISPDIAASPVSHKVGIAYTKPSFYVPPDPPIWYGWFLPLSSDVYFIESEDGITWDFSAKQNVSNIILPDTSRYPDTTWANGDTLRAYCDVSLFYDQNDYAHISFTTRGFWQDARLAMMPDSFLTFEITRDASMIWHWSEEHDTLTRIADGWYDVGDPDVNFFQRRGTGNYRSTVDRPCLAQDPETGYLYCIYVRCSQGDTSGGEGDSHGWANGEIYCSVSTDGGLNWSLGTNLTSTPSPNCTPGNCFDEDYPSQTLVVNDTLHIIYVEDKDAGAAMWEYPPEGTWTQNPVKYQKVPADLVPPGPPYVPNFYFHVGPVGATGVEEPNLVSGAVPEGYALQQNLPNPFNASTEIRYQIPEDSHVSLKIFNTLGQEVRTLVDAGQKAGEYGVLWDSRDARGQEVASGLYFCRLRAGEFSKIIKMVLIR